MNKLQYKKVLITGASSGIGQQLAHDYIEDQCEVIVCGRNKGLLETLYENKASIKNFDITNELETKEALSSLTNIDLVILNAGTCEYIDDVKNFDASLFHRVINTNLNGSVNCLAALLPQLKKGSHIAFISSSATFLPFSRAQAYGASKAALDYLSQSLAIDLAAYGITVSLIRPGFVDTSLTQKNDFSMPGMISVTEASHSIRKGLSQRKKIINFPFTFIFIMRFFSILPNIVWNKIAISMANKG